MIMDLLGPSYESVSGNPDSLMNLIDIYPFVAGLGTDTPDILYLATWEQFRDAGVWPRNIICIGGGEESRALFAEHSCSGLIYPKDVNAFGLLREVQEIFTKLNKLERELLDTLLAKAPLRAVLNACARFLECQVSLYDLEFRMLDYSDNFPPDDDDIIWKKTLSAKRSILPMFPREKVRMLPSDPHHFPRSTFLEIGGDIRPHLNIGFDYGDNRIATLIFWEVKKPITQYHQWLADYIADIIHPFIMERYNTNSGMRNYFRTSIATALGNTNTDSVFLLSCLARFGWTANDFYQILLVALPQENSKISHYLYNYENLFAEAYSDMIALRHDDYILILLHNGACSILNQCLPSLKKQLTLDDGICSIGQKFCDFTQLRLQYDLAVLPLHTKPHDNSCTRYFRDILETHVVTVLSSCYPLHAVCHYAAVRIHEYDMANGTDFLLTLETYLMNNKSLMAASDKLFIHRSTLMYRLNVIEKITPMQLDDPEERLHILLSCITLRVLNKNATQSGAPA
jgi:hypothetical protein